MALASGTRLGPYQIAAPIGAGGMGEVYRARDTRLGREVAIKVLPSDVASSPDRLARFEREARTVAALNHPNIVTIYSVEEAEGVHLLTMELVDGQSLDRSLPPGGFPMADLFRIGIPLAKAPDPAFAGRESAGRGKAGRRYAWGDTFEPLKGNTSATKVGRTTPVGVFVEGDTPEGVSDLTGNVAEWTGSLFGAGMDFEKAPFAYPYDPKDGREDAEAGPDIRRVLRGGAWYNVVAIARAAYRLESPPGNRRSYGGCRVVARSSPIST